MLEEIQNKNGGVGKFEKMLERNVKGGSKINGGVVTLEENVIGEY